MSMTPDSPKPANRQQPDFKPWYVGSGDHIDKYIVRTAIGRGSGGIVYEVMDEEGMLFALKLADLPLAVSGRNPLQCERLLTSALAHLAARDVPTVPKFIGTNLLRTPQGIYPYLVMELVSQGEPITAWARHTAPTFIKVAEVFDELATALGALASQGICHRDLKPQNILIAPGNIPKLIDLNSAFVPIQNTITEPAASAVPGTLAYFSPELAAAVLAEMESETTAHYPYAPTDDLYSLGCVFYEVLTGAIPCCDDLSATPATILRQITSLKPALPDSFNSSVPWALEKIVMKLLKKNPAERYQSGFRVADDIAAALETPDEKWEQPLVVHLGEPESPIPAWMEPKHEPAPTPPEGAAESPAAAERPAARPRLRWAIKLAIAAMAVVVALATGLIVGQDCPPEPAAGKGPTTVLCKAKMVVMGAAAMALSCVGLTKNMRAQDEEWLAACPAEARKTVKDLGIEPASLDVLEEGPTVRRPDFGYELKAGPVELKPSNLNWLGGGTIYGEIRIHSDGATVRFTKLKLDNEGRERPICAIAWPKHDAIGFRKVPKGNPNRVPDSELHPNQGFIYVVGDWVVIDFAQ